MICSYFAMAETLEISEQKRKLLEWYLQQRSEEANVPAAIPRRAPGAAIQLTFAQQQVWLHAQLAPHLPVYNEPFTVHRNGPLDVGALERSFTEIIRRHEAWRTTFATVDGEPVQVVHPPFEIKLPLVDLRKLPQSERVAAALQLATVDARQILIWQNCHCCALTWYVWLTRSIAFSSTVITSSLTVLPDTRFFSLNW